MKWCDISVTNSAEEEDGEDLDTDGRQLGIGLVLDLDVIEELQMQT